MFKFRSVAMAGMLAFATIVPTLAEAGPIMNAPLKVEKSSDVSEIACYRCRGWRGGAGWRGGRYYGRPGWRGGYYARRGWRGGYYGGYYGRRGYWGPGYRGYWGPGYWGPGVYVAPRIVVGPTVVYRRGYNAHTRWCLNRYGSYDPRSDTFLSYDGYRKVCRSPY